MFSLADQLLLGQTLVGAQVRMVHPRKARAFEPVGSINRYEPIGSVVRCFPYTPWSFNKTGEPVVAFEVEIKTQKPGIVTQIWYADEFEVITPALGPTSEEVPDV